MDYNSSMTSSYKCGFIHSHYLGEHQIVRVMVDKFAYPIQVKSYHAAKLLITKHVKKYGS